jgi:thiamine-phosphate pyrophosphorylase
MRLSARLLVITDPGFSEDQLCRQIERAAAGVEPGVLAVQLRDKLRRPGALGPFALRLRAVTRRLGVPLVVNGHAALARAVEADGVHLGAGAGSVADARHLAGDATWVSVACHIDADVSAAIADGADAVLVSPVFDTPSGGDKRGRGTDALRSARRLVDASGRDLLVYALGGVSRDSARECFEAGADGVACIRAVLAADDAADAARALSAWHPRPPGATFTRR